MVSNSRLADMFARGERQGKGSNMFIEGDTIYSYGHHFPIARRVEGGFLFNPAGYSNTTARHKARVRNAISGNYLEIEGADWSNSERQFQRNEMEMSMLQRKAYRARMESKREAYHQRVHFLQRSNERLRKRTFQI